MQEGVGPLWCAVTPRACERPDVGRIGFDKRLILFAL